MKHVSMFFNFLELLYLQILGLKMLQSIKIMRPINLGLNMF